MDISELLQQADKAGELAPTTVQLTPEQSVELQSKIDPLGAGMSDQERAEMLARNGLAPEAPAPAPAPALAPAAPVAPAPAPQPVLSQAPQAPQGPSPEMAALMESIKAIRDDLVESRRPPEKRYEDMSDLEKLRYDLVRDAEKAQEKRLGQLESTLQRLVQTQEAAARDNELNRQAYAFEQAVHGQVRSVILNSNLVDPALVTPEIQNAMAEIVLTRAAGYREDPATATIRVQGMLQSILGAVDKTRVMRAQPQIQRTAALPSPVPSGVPAVGIPRRQVSNDEVNRYYGGDRFTAAKENYARVPISAPAAR